MMSDSRDRPGGSDAPTSRAEARAARERAAAAEGVAPGQGAEGAADPSVPVSVPDQIVPRRAAAPADRPPEPIVYRPVSGSYVGHQGRPLPAPTARNVPVRIALVLIPLAALVGVSVVLWWGRTSPMVAGVVALVSLTLAVAAFFLAIGGLVVAVQRPTKKAAAVVALVLALLLVGWLGLITVTQALAVVN